MGLQSGVYVFSTDDTDSVVKMATLDHWNTFGNLEKIGIHLKKLLSKTAPFLDVYSHCASYEYLLRCMGAHASAWISIGIHGYLCISQNILADSSISMDIHGYPLDIHGYPWISYEFPRICMDIHGDVCISMDMHGYAWVCMDTLGYV